MFTSFGISDSYSPVLLFCTAAKLNALSGKAAGSELRRDWALIGAADNGSISSAQWPLGMRLQRELGHVEKQDMRGKSTASRRSLSSAWWRSKQ